MTPESQSKAVIYETGIFPRPQLGYSPNILSLPHPKKSGLHERGAGYDRGEATRHWNKTALWSPCILQAPRADSNTEKLQHDDSFKEFSYDQRKGTLLNYVFSTP